eukprot:208391_1
MSLTALVLLLCNGIGKSYQYSLPSIKPIRNNSVTKILIEDNMIFSMDLTIYSIPSINWGCIIYGGNDTLKVRMPGIWIYTDFYTNGLYVVFSNNDNPNPYVTVGANILSLNKKSNIVLQITQSSYKIVIDNTVVYDIAYPAHPTDVAYPLYVCDPWYDAANVLIENLQIIGSPVQHSTNDIRKIKNCALTTCDYMKYTDGTKACYGYANGYGPWGLEACKETCSLFPCWYNCSQTSSPTMNPTINPSINPTLSPTYIPTNQPTINPTTIQPTQNPTTLPTDSPTTPRPTLQLIFTPKPTQSLVITTITSLNTITTEMDVIHAKTEQMPIVAVIVPLCLMFLCFCGIIIFFKTFQHMKMNKNIDSDIHNDYIELLDVECDNIGNTTKGSFYEQEGSYHSHQNSISMTGMTQTQLTTTNTGGENVTDTIQYDTSRGDKIDSDNNEDHNDNVDNEILYEKDTAGSFNQILSDNVTGTDLLMEDIIENMETAK